VFAFDLFIVFIVFFVFILVPRHKSRESVKIGPHPGGHPSSQFVPGRPFLAPIYRWPDLKELVEFNTNYNIPI
jgi:hypothetical protein